MNRFAYKSIVGIFMSYFLFGQVVTVDAPRVVLKNIEFNVSYAGDFSQSDAVELWVNGKSIQPTSLSNESVIYNDVLVENSGEASFRLLQGDKTIHQFDRKVISGWISVLPPLIAIILAFASGVAKPVIA